MKKPAKIPRKLPKKDLQKKQRVLFGALTILIAAGAIYVLAGWAYTFFYVQPREARIDDIYQSLGISKDYRLEYSQTFGDKRVYGWDKDRSYSSEKQYIVGKTVDGALDELDQKVRTAGFTFIDEPNQGPIDRQFHYTSDNGEFLRLTVSSKLRNDAFQNFTLMNPGDSSFPDALFSIDPNAGPSNISIKVNLDDNNE